MARSSKNSLRKLSRLQLLELLAQQEREINMLRKELEEKEKQLLDRRIIMDDCGSIAEAALRLNGIFEAAQRAADDYLESVKGPDMTSLFRDLGIEETP